MKAHWLLLAHLDRQDIPPILAADSKYVLKKCLQLLDEMLKIASMPRAPRGLGWLTPTQAVIELQQSITQAVSISARKGPTSGKVCDSAIASPPLEAGWRWRWRQLDHTLALMYLSPSRAMISSPQQLGFCRTWRR